MHPVSPTRGIDPMRDRTSPTQARRGTSRRLASHVLAPVVALGILAVAGATAGVTMSQHDAAIRSMDARAGAIRDVSEASLKRTGKLPAGRVAGMKPHLSAADRPLPGGRAVASAGGRRVYSFTVGSRGAKRRLQFSLPAASVGQATVKALAISAGAGLLILLLLVGAVYAR